MSQAVLRSEFNAEPGSFILRLRNELVWDWLAFRRLTAAMFDVADEAKGKESIDTWIAQGFWYCDKWIPHWTSHPNFSRPEPVLYEDALSLIHDLAWFLFMSESPYEDDTLRKLAKR